MNSKFAKHRLLLIMFAVIASLFTILILKERQYIFDTVIKGIDFLEHLVQTHYSSAVMIFWVIFILAMICCLPVSGLLTIGAGYLFGPLHGALYSIIGILLGSSLLFLIVHNFFGLWVQRHFKKRLVDLNEEIEQYGTYYLVSLRLMPGTPTFMINIILGLTKISLFTFITTTLIGVTPRLTLYSFLGYQLHSIKLAKDVSRFWPIFLIFLLLALLVFSPVIFKRRYQNKEK